MIAGLAVERDDDSRSAYWNVLFRGKPRLFTYSDTLTLGFDYFLESPDADLAVKMIRPDGRMFVIPVSNPVHGAWAHVELPLATARGADGVPEALATGTPIVTMFFFTYATRFDRPMYVDSVRVVDVP